VACVAGVGCAVKPREHGTMRGFHQHRYRHETPCDACNAVRRAVKQTQQRRQRNKGKCAAGLGWPMEAAG
jgi:hypothetical protein